MAENLGLALVKLFGRDAVTQAKLEDLITATAEELVEESASGEATGSAGAPAAARPALAASTIDLDVATLDELIVAANGQYERAQELLRNGDWGGYGAEMDALQATLQRLVEITGVELAPPEPASELAPTPVPTPAP
jgi:hypothetical protein